MPPHSFDYGTTASNGVQEPRQAFQVQSPNVQYTDDAILSQYVYQNTKVIRQPGQPMTVVPTEVTYNFKVERKVPRLG